MTKKRAYPFNVKGRRVRDGSNIVNNGLAVVVSDFRLPAILAAIQIYQDMNGRELLTHSVFLDQNDFGNNSPPYWNRVKVWLISKIFHITLVDDEAVNSSEGVDSSLISITNDSRATGDKYPNLHKKLARISGAAAAIGDYVVSKKFGSVAIFNGRLANSRPISVKCRDGGVKVYNYEYGTIPFHFTLTENEIHDSDAFGRAVVELFKNKSIAPISFSILAKNEYSVSRKMVNRFSALYENGTIKKYEFCLLLSSPHEFLALGELSGKTNVAICEEVLNLMKGKRGAIRSHPNQVLDPSAELESAEIADLAARHGGVDYFPPQSSINTHELIKNCREVWVGGSSIAIDAAVLGADVKFVQPSIYKKIIEFANEYADAEHIGDVVGQLYGLVHCVWQCPYKPINAIIHKMLARMDSKICRPPEVGIHSREPNTADRK